MVNRDKSITDNLSPSGRVDSIADRGNLQCAGAGARMNDREREREYCNFSDIEERRARYANPSANPAIPSMAEPNMDWEIEHAWRKQFAYGHPGQSSFDRGSMLPQPPNDRLKR